MYSLQKRFENDFFEVVEVKPHDVSVLLEHGVALFSSETHAQYAQSVLGAMQVPDWRPNYKRLGHLLTDDCPFFCPADSSRFAESWLRLMCQEARVKLSQLQLPAQETVFELHPTSPAPAPWAIIVSKSSHEHFVVDRMGHVLGAKGKERLKNMANISFADELTQANGRHLEIIEAA